MTTHITVKATVSALGLKRGDVAVVELTPTTDAMVANGFWLWLDAPEPSVTVTEAVKARKPRAKKAEPEDVPVEADPVHVDYMNWADDGGDYAPDES